MKRANASAALTVPTLDAVVSVRKDRTYDVDEHPWDEVAKAHPWVFEQLDDTDEAPVEEATAEPGTKRTTKRPAKKTAAAKKTGDE